jgi:hypothetical protein
MRMKGELAKDGLAAEGGNGRARVGRRFSRGQLGALGGLLIALLGVWAAGVYWVLSESGGLPAVLGIAGGDYPQEDSSPVAEETLPATEIPTRAPTASPTPLALPTRVTIPGRIDPELGWAIFQGYLERLAIHDVQGANILAENPLEWELCMELGSEETCQQMLDLAYQEGAAIDRADLVDIWADENQLIMGGNPVATSDGEGESRDTTYSRVALMFLRNGDGEIKFLLLQSTLWAGGATGEDETRAASRLMDSDQDGLSDYEENCTENNPPCEQPTDPLQRDTDEDGYWDGIEVAGDSDPNNPTSLP